MSLRDIDLSTYFSLEYSVDCFKKRYKSQDACHENTKSAGTLSIFRSFCSIFFIIVTKTALFHAGISRQNLKIMQSIDNNDGENVKL